MVECHLKRGDRLPRSPRRVAEFKLISVEAVHPMLILIDHRAPAGAENGKHGAEFAFG